MTEQELATVDLSTSLAGLHLPNPVLSASGCAGTGRELATFFDAAGLGAFVSRSIAVDPRAGHAAPRMVETPSGMLTAVGEQGPGISGFLASELPWLASRRIRVVVSIAGSTLSEYAELARRIGNSPGATAIEINLSCRNTDSAGRVFGSEPYQAAKVTGVVRRDSPPDMPVLAKLTPDVHNIVDVARAVVDAGADGLVLVHSPLGMAIDPVTLRPALGAGTGALSGPAMHPLALRCVWQVHEALPHVPLIGVGGVRTGLDALGMLVAGATSVQVGSTIFADPSAPRRILEELRHELASRDLAHVADLIGRAHRLEGEDL